MCAAVYALIQEHGLDDYYRLKDRRGVPAPQRGEAGRFDFLNQPEVLRQWADYVDPGRVRVTMRLPAIHCIACLWLLENLGRLHPGILTSRVEFARKELSVDFDPAKLSCSQLASLLVSLGYEPDLRFSDAAARKTSTKPSSLLMRLGLAGFAFGNTMLFSLAAYLGLDSFSGSAFQQLTGWISLALSVPVVTYAAEDYWRSAWNGWRQRVMNIDIPIVAGLAALWLQSTYEWFSRTGEGYFDSLAGLVFFLLCGRWFQKRTYDRIHFDQDYRSFFPMSVSRCGPSESRIALSEVRVGDRLKIRNGEMIPCDGLLLSNAAHIDYSFVTGESEPQRKDWGAWLFAGGKLAGSAIEVECAKPVSESYLTSLWNHETFAKVKHARLNPITDAYSRRFTRLVLTLALVTAACWAPFSPAMAVKAFVSVLIVACPCALALAAPFVFGTAVRALHARGWHLKNGTVLESLALIDSLVFDKTGTLTATGVSPVRWIGPPLTRDESQRIRSLAEQSLHPLSIQITRFLANDSEPVILGNYREIQGCGIEGTVDALPVALGSRRWIMDALTRERSASLAAMNEVGGSSLDHEVHVLMGGAYRGAFVMEAHRAPGLQDLFRRLEPRYALGLLSGDQDRERELFARLLGPRAELRFSQSPFDKLEFIASWQQLGRKVLFAAGFFAAFLWSVKSGQYRDTVTPPLRVLLEETNLPKRKQEKSSSSRRQPQT